MTIIASIAARAAAAKLAAFAFVLISFAGLAPAQTITTFAGNGMPGFSGDGGPATSAKFSFIGGIARDSLGNVYISDAGNHRVRKVAPNGIISTFAGNGTAAMAGDGGPATQASFDFPIGLVVDAANNVYIADYNNNRVRMVNPAGIITTVAGNGFPSFGGDGGPATSAMISQPFGLAMDASGNLYIGEDGNKRIRKVTAAGIISTVIGNGQSGSSGDGGPASQAQVVYPRGITVDASGVLFFADGNQHRIRKITPDGIVHHVSGTTWGFAGDGGPAAQAQLQGPQGIAVHPDGGLYFVDMYNNRVRRISSGGIIDTVAGNGAAGYSGDGGPALQASLNNPENLLFVTDKIFVTDSINYRVRVFTLPAATVPTSPSIGEALAGNTQASVAFEVPADSNGSAINGYTVTSTPAGGVDTDAGTSKLLHLVTGLANGTSYQFNVTASNAIGTSANSAASNAVTPAGVPGAPTMGTAIASNQQATLTFSAPANPGDGPVSGYTVTSSPAGGVDADAGSTMLTRTITGLQNHTRYTFTVRATNATGSGLASAPSNYVTPLNLPSEPLNVSAEIGELANAANVSFSAPLDYGDGISGYRVTSHPAGGVDTSDGQWGETHTVVGLVAGTSYTFTVQATSPDGAGPSSVPSNAVTPFDVPGAPISVVATAGVSSGTVTFEAPASDGGRPITGYAVESSNPNMIDHDWGSPSLTHRLTLIDEMTYTFRVRAMNLGGTGPASAESNAITAGLPPDAPAKPSAVAGNSQATVSFATPNQNGSAATGYVVTSSPAGGVDAHAGTTALSHVVTGLNNGTAYTFTVVATNALGASPPSPASDPVTPQAPVVPGAPAIGIAYADDAKAIVNFTPPTLDGGSAITGYTVVSSPSGGIDSHAGSTGLAHIVTGLTNGTAYTFTVKASNAAGTGPASAASNSVVPVAAAGHSISTIAGGWLGDGGAASLAGFNTPYDVVVDSAGNQYIADRGNHRIRKISSAGVISTFAGTGISGFSGDGGQASLAKLHHPSSLAIDLLGNVYIADTSNNRIRKVSTSGVISTIVGDGTTGVLNNPQGVALDAARNVYISEFLGHRVRKYVPGGSLTTVAGNGVAGYSGDGGSAVNASLHSPGGIVVDSSGTIFVADSVNSRIRSISSGGVINTHAGAGYTDCENGAASVASFADPRDVTLDSSGNVVVLDLCGVRKISNAQVTTIAGLGTGESGFSGDGGPATSARFWLPNGIAFDSNGNLLIADSLNQRIRVINASGIINTSAGVGVSGDGGAATSAALNRPKGLTYDSAGNLYVVDRGNHRIRKVSTSGVVTTVAGNGSPGFSGDLGPAIDANLNRPTAVAVDSAGFIYIADSSNYRIRIVSPAGIISTFAGSGISGFSGDGGVATEAKLRIPSGVAVDASGTVFIADTGNYRIRRVVGSLITTVAGTGISGFSGDGAQAVDAQFSAPTSVAVDGVGNFYFTDSSNRRIRKVAADGVITTVAGNGTSGFGGDGGAATAASMCQPSDVSTSAAGVLFFADACNHNIRKVSAGGIISTVAGNGTSGFGGDGNSAPSLSISAPSGIASNAAGNVAFADSLNNRIRLLSEGSIVAPPDLSVGDVTIVEGNSGTKVATFTISLSAASDSAVSFDIATANGTATAGSDYVAKSLIGESIPAGSTSKTFDVTISGDTIVESDESFAVTVSNISGATVGDADAEGTIINDDVAFGPTLSIGDISITEGDRRSKTATFTISLSEASSSAVTYNIATANGSAIAGSDYVAKSLSGQSIPAGSLSRTFSMAIKGDTAVEPDETFLVDLSNVAGATVADGQAVGTIVNDDGGSATPTLSIADVSVSEGNSGTKVATFTVNLSGTSTSAVSYDIATANGTATAGSDYVASSLTGQSIAAGGTSKTFAVTINGDADVEPNETFTVTVTNVVGASVADGQAVGTISNDDGGGSSPSLSIGDISITEGNSRSKTAVFTVSLSAASSGPVTYNIATANGTALAGSDYVAKSLNGLSIPAGSLSKTFSMAIKGDTTAEPDETFLVNVSNVAGATVADGQAVGTIVNDDGGSATPTLSIADVSVSEGNSGTKVATFTVNLSGTSTGAVSYDIATANGTATAGSDYAASSLTGQSIAAGGTSKTFAVTVNGDADVEPNETFTVTVNNVVGATISDGQAVGTISNDDGGGSGPTLSIGDISITEGNSWAKQATFTITLSAAASSPVTYNIATANGSALAGSDYVAKSLTGLSIPAGSTSKTFSMAIKGDTAVEPNETFLVNVSNVAGATVADGQAEGTIVNDDGATITVARLSTGGLFDDIDDHRGEPVRSGRTYAASLLEQAKVLCERAGAPMLVAVDGVENLTVLADLAATVAEVCPQAPRYDAVLKPGTSADNIGFLIGHSTTAGAPRVQLQSVDQLATAAVFQAGTRARTALHPQPPLAVRLLVDAGGTEALPLTVVLTKQVTTGARRVAQARDLAQLLRTRTKAAPDERLVVLGEFSTRETDAGDLSRLLKDVLVRIAEPQPQAERALHGLEGKQGTRSHVLVSKSLLTDYPELHVETARGGTDIGDNNASTATQAGRDPQVLVIPR